MLVEAELKVQDVSKNFNGIEAIRNCSLEVHEGSITGLIGPNGAGKTTLFNLITGFHQPTSGDVYFRGEQIQPGLQPHEVFHRGLYRSFQTTRQLATITVLENLLLAPANQVGEEPWNTWLRMGRVRQQEEENIQKAREVLQFLGMTDKANEYAGNLSGGQRKLLELGRLMMVEPRLVLLDEPGAGVHPHLKDRVNDRIQELNRSHDMTFFIIEHDMTLMAQLCDPIIVMVNGRKLTQGSPREIQSNQDVIDAYLGKGG